MSEPPTFRRLRNADIAIIHDDVEETFWWLLRSLPSINALGFSTFTYPTSWRTLNTGGQFQSYRNQYDYLDYDYKVLGEIEEESFRDDLVVFTNEYYESNTEYSVDHLVSRYSGREETLLVVTDSHKFTPRGGQRPLYQEQFVEDLGKYQRLYTAHESIYEESEWKLPLIDTKNIFLHDNANLYELVTGNQIQSTEDLFEILPEAPYLPLYDVFSRIFAREEEYGSVPLDQDDVTGLQRWLRRRVEWDRKTATEVAEKLNRIVGNDGSTFDPSYAKRSPAMQEARSAAKEIDPQESSINKRYLSWLQRDNL